MRDAGLAGLHQAVNAYARRVQAAGPNTVGFIYYSGHGAADAGTKHPPPISALSSCALCDAAGYFTAYCRREGEARQSSAPHAPLHSCGYCLADQGTDLGRCRTSGPTLSQAHSSLHPRCRAPI